MSENEFEIKDKNCKIHDLISKNVELRLRAMEKTLYDDQHGITRVIPVIKMQHKIILTLLIGMWVTVAGGIALLLTKGGIT